MSDVVGGGQREVAIGNPVSVEGQVEKLETGKGDVRVAYW